MNFPLHEAEEPLRAALTRCMDRDLDLRPFVVVDKVGDPTIFVQYARLVKDGALAFDVPALGIVLARTDSVEDAARRGIAALLRLGVDRDERVDIVEDQNDPSGRVLRLALGQT